MKVVLYIQYWSKMLLSVLCALQGCCTFCLSRWESRKATGTGAGEVRGFGFALKLSVPSSEYSDFIEETMGEVPAPLQSTWNSEHSGSPHLRYIQPSQPLHFLHHSCFISSVKCSLGSVGQESLANRVVRLGALHPNSSSGHLHYRTVVPPQLGYWKSSCYLKPERYRK